MFVLKLTLHNVEPPSTQQCALKEQVICFPQNTDKIFQVLLHSVVDLVDIIQMVFLASNTLLTTIREGMKTCRLLEVCKRVAEV